MNFTRIITYLPVCINSSKIFQIYGNERLDKDYIQPQHRRHRWWRHWSKWCKNKCPTWRRAANNRLTITITGLLSRPALHKMYVHIYFYLLNSVIRITFQLNILCFEYVINKIFNFTIHYSNKKEMNKICNFAIHYSKHNVMHKCISFE